MRGGSTGQTVPTRSSTNASRCEGSGRFAAVTDDADTAGGAARAAAANAGVRDVVAQAGLEHAESLRHPDRPPVAIGEVDRAAAPLMDGTRALGQQRKSDQPEIPDHE